MYIERTAYARAGLLGNPSDGYFGKTISVSVKNFYATVRLEPSDELYFKPAPQDDASYVSIEGLLQELNLTGYNGGVPLLKACVKTFANYCKREGITLANKNFTLSYSSTIPRQVGMAGSSALVIACLKALCEYYSVKIDRNIFPTLALAVETEELGITAGLQDRVIQTWEGCVYMDFEKEHLLSKGYGQYAHIDVKLLPRMYIAYKTSLSKVSGKVLNPIRQRFEQGDRLTIESLQQIAALAAKGRLSIINEDELELASLINANFDLRTKVMSLSDENLELVNTARNMGVSASFTGSGGAIIGIIPHQFDFDELYKALKQINAETVILQTN